MLTALALMPSTRAISRGAQLLPRPQPQQLAVGLGQRRERLVERAVERIARVVLLGAVLPRQPRHHALLAHGAAPVVRQAAAGDPVGVGQRRLAGHVVEAPPEHEQHVARARRRRSRGRCGGAGTAGPARRRPPPAPRTAGGGRGRRWADVTCPVCPDRPRIFRRRDGGPATQPVGVASAVGAGGLRRRLRSPSCRVPAVEPLVGALLVRRVLSVGSAEPVEPEVPSAVASSPSPLPVDVAGSPSDVRRRTSAVGGAAVAGRAAVGGAGVRVVGLGRLARRSPRRAPGRRRGSAASNSVRRSRSSASGTSSMLRAELLQLRPDRGERLLPVRAELARQAHHELGGQRVGHALDAGVVDRGGEVLRDDDVDRADQQHDLEGDRDRAAVAAAGQRVGLVDVQRLVAVGPHQREA